MILCKDNLFNFELQKDMIDDELFLLITGVRDPVEIEEKRWGDWICAVFQEFYRYMTVASQPNILLHIDSKHAFYNKNISLVYRKDLDLTEGGLLVNGKLPFVHIHFGHGHVGYEAEPEISVGESEEKFFSAQKYVQHVNSHEGLMWMAAFPTCYGAEIAKYISEKSDVFSVWGSSEREPVTTQDALFDLPHWLNDEKRKWVKDSASRNTE